MTTDLRESLIQHALRDKAKLFGWARCLKRLGMVLAPAGYAVFQFDSELSARLDGTWLQAAMHYLPLSMVKEI
ncbi:MAG: hypothetical protein M0T84_08675, partial [Betaproteobacteria bacterium]|nr:hypothetical protein [Betaproteobacteria bacterium]